LCIPTCQLAYKHCLQRFLLTHAQVQQWQNLGAILTPNNLSKLETFQQASNEFMHPIMNDPTSTESVLTGQLIEALKREGILTITE
jgi:hypothetical protein